MHNILLSSKLKAQMIPSPHMRVTKMKIADQGRKAALPSPSAVTGDRDGHSRSYRGSQHLIGALSSQRAVPCGTAQMGTQRPP